MTIRTSAPSFYSEPTSQEIKEIAGKLNIQKYSSVFATDIANIVAGGSFKSESDIKEQLNREFNIDIERRKDGKYRGNGKWCNSYDDAKTSLIDKSFDYHKNINQFIENLNLNNISGDTPLEKALNIISMLSAKSGGEASSSDVTTDGDNIIPIFNEGGDKGESTAKLLNEAVEVTKHLDDEDKELQDLSDDDETDNVRKLLKNNYLMKVLDASQKIDKISSIKTKPSNKLKRDNDGDVLINRQIRGFDEFHLINKNELINNRNYLAYKVINSESYVQDKYKREYKMPFVTLIIDDSGSMSDDYKNAKAIGILHNITKRVMKGECWMLFSFFERSCHKFYQVSQDDAKEFYKKVHKHRFNNGGTDVANCIKEALIEYNAIAEANKGAISSKDKYLIVVNDGQDDTSSLNKQMLSGAKLHAFILQSENQHLKNIALSSGGTYHQEL